MSVLVVTSVGDIVVDLHADRCPLTSKNFLKLCKMKYYNGCLFHKVEKDFMAQTGDRTGTGSGGDSLYKFLYGDQARFFDDEIHPDLKHSKIGTVAMASAGKNCNASQFYFTLRDELDYLDGKHTVFGVVEEQEGLETLAKINEAFVDDKGRPLKNIRIKHTYILDDPFSDPAQLAEFIPEKSPEGKPEDETAEERLEDNWVPRDDTLGAAELEETLRAKEAHTNAAILESIGDIPDADIRPPENVLFVCKLNPVTQDEDLNTIFSRFGNVVSADIIRDFKTGDSLCYAFIEFETQEACELAYIKMDNTLIDDRRIHVDFSQSVSKLWIQYRHGKRSQNKDNGCFKCGSTNHIAKNCNQESGSKPEASKYVLKEANAQRGGGCQSYEMVFDRDDIGSTESSGDETKTKQKKLKADDHNYEDTKQRGYSRGGPDSRSYKYRNDYANREYRQDVERHSSRMSEEYHRNREMKSMDVDLRKKGIEDHRTCQRGRYEENGKIKYHDSSIEHGNVSTEKEMDRHGDKEPWKRHESSRYTRDNVEYWKPGSSDRHREDGSRRGEKLDKYSSRSGRNDKGSGKRDERRDEHGRHKRRHREEKRR